MSFFSSQRRFSKRFFQITESDLYQVPIRYQYKQGRLNWFLQIISSSWLLLLLMFLFIDCCWLYLSIIEDAHDQCLVLKFHMCSFVCEIIIFWKDCLNMEESVKHVTDMKSFQRLISSFMFFKIQFNFFLLDWNASDTTHTELLLLACSCASSC